MGAFRDYFVYLLETYVKKPLEAGWDKITAGFDRVHDWNYVYGINIVKTVSQLESKWSNYPEHAKTDPEISSAYENKKEELTAEGMLTTADYALGYVGTGIAKGVKHIVVEAHKNLTPIFDDLMDEAQLSEESRKHIRSIASSGEFGLNAVISFLLGVTLYPAISTATAPAWRIAEHTMDAKIHSGILPPDLLLRGKWRGLIGEDQYHADMLKYGFTEKDILSYEKVNMFYPAPQDLVTWQAREVYEPDAITKYGLDNEFENLDLKPFHKAGMTDEQIKNYWRAHWQHASWTQVADMLHRKQLTVDEVRAWFRLVEIPPYWRDKFIAISYHTVTRVDLRRLYKSGIYNREQVLAGYEALGNAPDISEYLTQWTEKEYSPDDKDLTKTEILKKYRNGELEKDSLTTMLSELGYNPDETAWIISLEDYKLKAAAVEDEANLIVAEVVAGTKTYADAEESLTKLNLPIKAKTRYLNKIKSEVRKLSRKPEKADLKTWLKLKIISEEQFKTEMLSILYSSKDIDRYIQEIKGVK